MYGWSLNSIASAIYHRSDYNIDQTDQTMNIVADRKRFVWYTIYFIHNHKKIIIILYLYNAPLPLHPPLQSQRCTVRSIFFYVIIRIYRYLYSIIYIYTVYYIYKVYSCRTILAQEKEKKKGVKCEMYDTHRVIIYCSEARACERTAFFSFVFITVFFLSQRYRLCPYNIRVCI